MCVLQVTTASSREHGATLAVEIEIRTRAAAATILDYFIPRRSGEEEEAETPLARSYLVRQKQADRLQRLLPAVHVVTQEQVVGLGREATVLEEAQQVRVLPVDVAADLDRRLELEQVGLAHEHLPRSHAQGADLGLGEGDGAARASGAGVDQALDDGVEGSVLWASGFLKEGEGGGGRGRFFFFVRGRGQR